MASAWIEHVKRYAKDYKVPYNKALTLAKPSYQKGKNLGKKPMEYVAEVILKIISDDPDSIEDIKKQIDLKQDKYIFKTAQGKPDELRYFLKLR